MVYTHHSQEVKERALLLWEQGYLEEEVAELLGVSRASLYRWRNNQNQYGSVIPPPQDVQGRPPQLSMEVREALINYACDSPELYLAEIQEWLVLHYDAVISVPQLHQILKDSGITFKLLRRAASERDEEERGQWKERYQTQYTGSQCLFIDETSKDDRTVYRHYGRAISGERAVISANFVRGERYSLVAALGVNGYVAAKVVPGSLDGEEFLMFIVEDVLPQTNPFPGPCSVLVMDNCAIHKLDAVQEAIEGAGRVLLFLPPYSPDLNPIEESFSAVKAWIRRHYEEALSAEDPELFLLEASATVTGEKAVNWIRNSGYIVDV